MNQPIQPMQSSNFCLIPVKFIQQPSTLLPPTQSGVKQKKVKECRICLQGEESGKMISPCKCTGSVEYTHSKCISQWIKRKLAPKSKSKIRCELCDTQFSYYLASRRTFDCQQLSKNYEKDKAGLRCFGVIYGLFILMFFGVIGLLAASVNNVGDGVIRKALMPNNTTAVIFVTLLIIYFIILLVIAVLFISQYVVREDQEIREVSSYKQAVNFLKNYKIYFKR